MERAAFSLLHVDAPALVKKFVKDLEVDIPTLFSGDNSLFEYLTEDALVRLRNRIGTQDEIRALVRDEATLIQFVDVAVRRNPYRFFNYASDKGYMLDEAEPPGVMLPFRRDPKEIGISTASPAVNFRIGFAENEAPAQQHRAPGLHGSATFMRRADALRLMECEGPPKLRKKKLHVFVVDQGMSREYVEALGGPGTYGGMIWWDLSNWPFPGPPRFPPKPGQGELPREQRHRYRTLPHWHAHMTVRNVLSIAGHNRGLSAGEQPIVFYDIPVIPDRVGAVLDTATDIAFQQLSVLIASPKIPPDEPRIIVNAWGVKDRLREQPQGKLTEDSDHGLNSIINYLASDKKIPVVFAAGNTGSFSPDPEAGPYDRGPGRSIWHPNQLEFVLSTAACDCTGKWIGSSSQGSPGPGLLNRNPKLSTPSFFREDLDDHVANTGSSASCGMLAGLIAKMLRMDLGPVVQQELFSSAKQIGHTDHSERLGYGVAVDTS